MWKRRVAALLILLCCLLAVNAALDYALGFGVKRGFAAGTGCRVTLENPQLSFFPLRGTVEKVSVIHPTEAGDEGFHARKASIRLHFWKLLSKKVFLSDLLIEGVRVRSAGSESGFLNTLSFVLGGDKADKNSKEPATWHSFLSANWKVKLKDIVITADEPSATPQVIISTGPYSFQWKQVRFVGDQFIKKEDPSRLKGQSGDFGLQYQQARTIWFGEFDAVVFIQHGLLSIGHANVTKQDAGGKSETKIEGRVFLRDEGKYELNTTSTLQAEYLAGLVPELRSFVDSSKPSVVLDAAVSGPLTNPGVEGSLSLLLEEPLPIFKRKECALRKLQTNFKLDNSNLQLVDTNIEDLTESSSVNLKFNKPLDFEGHLSLVLNKDKKILQKCLLPEGAEEDSPFWSAAVLKGAVTDSINQATFSGSLLPFRIDAEIHSETHVSDASTRSKLEIKLNYNDAVLQVAAKERGVFQQIQSQASRLIPAAAYHTPFKTDVNSNIDASAVYDFQAKRLEISRLKIVRYPALRIIARLAPFISEKALEFLTASVDSESLLDTSFRALLSPQTSSFDGSGTLRVKTVKLGDLAAEEFGTNIDISNKGFFLHGISLKTGAGAISGQLDFTNDGNLEGRFSSEPVALANFGAVTKYFPNLSGEAVLDVEVKGKTINPDISGNLKIFTNFLDDEGFATESKIVFSGTPANMTFSANLLGDAASVEFQGPINENSPDREIELNAKLRAFPLEIMQAPSSNAVVPSDLNGEKNNSSKLPQLGFITADLNYKGLRSNFLSGNGKLQIESLLLQTGMQVISSEHPFVANISKGRMSFADARLWTKEHELVLSGYLDQNLGWQAQLQGSWELSNLGLQSPGLEQVSGGLTANIKIRGSLKEPLLSGPIVLSKGAISFPLGNTFIGADDIEVQANLERETLRFDSIRARIGAGQLIGSGKIDQLLSPSRRAVKLNATFREVSLEPIEKLSTRMDGHLVFASVEPSSYRLAGDISLSEALYENSVDLNRVLKALASTIAGTKSVSMAGKRTAKDVLPLAFDLRIRANNGLLVETNILKCELAGDLHVGGSLAQPRLKGGLTVLDGTFGLEANEFQIAYGKLNFVEGSTSLDPALNVLGETTVKTDVGDEHYVQMLIAGTVSAPEVSFSSDAGLSETEILSLLSWGGSVEKLSILQFGAGSANLSYAEILDPSSDITFTERLSGLASFKSVSVDAATSLQTGEVVPVVTAKKPVTKQVNLSLKAELSNEQVSSATLDYPLTPFLSLAATWSSHSVTNPDLTSGTFEAGLVYRWTFPGLSILPPQVTGARKE